MVAEGVGDFAEGSSRFKHFHFVAFLRTRKAAGRKKRGRRGKVRDGVVGFVADWTMARVRIFSHPSDLPSLSF